MWDLPGPGLEPVSPALAGGFLTTAPPGKSPSVHSFIHQIINADAVLWSRDTAVKKKKNWTRNPTLMESPSERTIKNNTKGTVSEYVNVINTVNK